MKAQGAVPVRVLVGLVLVLVLAAAFWGLRGPARSSLASKDGRTSPISVIPHTELERKGAPPATGLVSNLLEQKFAANPFLRKLQADLDVIGAIPDSFERDRRLEALAKGVAIAGVPTALDFLNHSEASKLNSELQNQLVRHWAGNDPRAAAAWANQLAAGPTRQAAFSGVAVVWADQNLTDALGWVRELPEGSDRNSAALAVAYEAARTDPLEALKLAIELPADVSRDNLIGHAVSQWASQSPEAAAEWGKQIQDGALRERVLSSVATAWSQQDPVAAATFAINSISPGKPQDDAVVSIVQRWVQKEPEKAAAWVNQFPQGSLHDVAVQNLVQIWTDKDAGQVANWLDQLGAGTNRDLAVGTYVNTLARSTPENAAKWAATISDEPQRLKGLETVGEAWMAIDPNAAKTWIAQAPLPETTKARLLALDSRPGQKP